MKRLFESVGLITLVCFSFFYTEKTVNVVREYDDIMITIKEKQKEYKIKPIDATIKENTIIPGVSGKSININKSYSKMKRYGNFNDTLLVYEKIDPTISINKNLDKYIIKGNETKNMISLLFLVKNDDNIDPILTILKGKKVKANFFINSNWLEKNENKLKEIVLEGHTIGNLGVNGIYTDSNYSWLDHKIKTVSKKEFGYCYNEIEDNQSLKLCEGYKNYTIRPNIIINRNPLSEIKEKISPGSIISLPINQEVFSQLGLIIEYIQSKGFNVTTLENHLKE